MPVIVPNVLGDHVLQAEAFYRATQLPHDGVFDMSEVSFVRPYGVIALVSAARTYFSHTRKPLHLIRLQLQVHQYLERVDMFKVAGEYVSVDNPLQDYFDREQSTPNLLELTEVRNAAGVITVIAQAERIFSYWLQVPNLRGLLSVLSELCGNVYQHSGDRHGMVLIQTHKARSRGKVRVRVAIGDLGMGVRGSLRNHFGELGGEPLDYLYEAMRGRTSRHTQRGGLGLRLVERTVGDVGGYMWLRSETAAILTTGEGAADGHAGLAYMSGTQVAVDFHAPLDGTEV